MFSLRPLPLLLLYSNDLSLSPSLSHSLTSLSYSLTVFLPHPSPSSLSLSLSTGFSTDGITYPAINPVSMSLRVRDPIVLNCTIPTSLPPATVVWTKETNPLTASQLNSGRLGITLAGQLVISSYESTDSGQYQCLVSNDVIGGEPILTTNFLLS